MSSRLIVGLTETPSEYIYMVWYMYIIIEMSLFLSYNLSDFSVYNPQNQVSKLQTPQYVNRQC